ncbi:MAG TPA: hypothetical protein VIU64_15490 [Polyangia bacterium]
MLGASLTAAAIFLIPVAGSLLVRGRREQSLWEVAMVLPTAVAVDLVSVLLLCRLMTLETAAMVSRGLWLVGLGAVWLRRVRRSDGPRWPRALDPALVTHLVIVMVAAVVLSMMLSRTTMAWDRDFHTPLVTALRAQRLPFVSMYEPHQALAYHYTADAQAAMIQTYSAIRLSSALALSVHHDVMFALLAAAVVLAAAALGIRRLAPQVAIFAALVLAGPVTLFHPMPLPDGYSVVNMYSLSFRPHVCLSFLLIAGFAGGVMSGVLRRHGGEPRGRLYPSLLGITAALALTDEATLLLLGAFLGVVWLQDPGCLSRTRWGGALKLASLAAVIGGAILVFGGPLGLHAERYPIDLVAPRAPGWVVAPMSLAEAEGRRRMVEDLLPVLGVFLAALIAVARPARRETRTVAVAFVALASLAMVAMTCFDFNHQPMENHRWVTVAYVLAPLVGAFLMADRSGRRPWRLYGPLGLVALSIYASNGLAVASSATWLAKGQGAAMRDSGYQGTDNLYRLDCRAGTGARLRERLVATYVDRRRPYPWTACHPSLLAGPAEAAGGHKIKTLGGLASGPAALDDLGQNILVPGQPLRIACWQVGAGSDPICGAALAPGVGSCQPSGGLYTVCQVPAEHLARLR